MCSDLSPSLRQGGYETETLPTHELVARTGKAIFKKTDASRPEDVEALVDAAVKEFGRLDMSVHFLMARPSVDEPSVICLLTISICASYSMVNNAGVFCGQNRIAEEPVEAFEKTMVGNRLLAGERTVVADSEQAVNARGPFLGMKYAIGQMMKQSPHPSGSRGWVINIASIGGLVGLPMEREYTH